MSRLEQIINKELEKSDNVTASIDFKGFLQKSNNLVFYNLFIIACSNFDIFAKTTYAGVRSLPPHSLEIYEMFVQHDKIVIKAPRGHVKSTTVQLIVVHAILYPDKYKKMIGTRDNQFKILQLSYSAKQSKKWHKEAQEYLSAVLQNFSLPFKLGRYDKKTDTTEYNNVLFQSSGITSAQRGLHPHLIITDDIMVDIGLVTSSNLIDLYLAVVTGMRLPETKIINVGTPLTNADLLAVLSKTSDNKKLIKYVKSKTSRFPISEKGYVYMFYQAIKPDGSVLWNERPMEWLMETKKEMGSTIFNREFMCIPVSTENAIFKEEDLSRCNRTEFSYKEVGTGRLFVGCDLANSLSPKSSFSVFVLVEEIGGNGSGTIVIRDFWIKRSIKSREKLEVLYKWQVKYGLITLVNVEKNGYQSSFVDYIKDDDLRISVQNKFIKNGLMKTGENLRFLNVEGDFTGAEKHLQDVGIPNLQSMVETQKLLFPAKNIEDIRQSQIIKDDMKFWIIDPKNELRYISTGVNDDITMAVFITVKGYKSKMGSGSWFIA